MAPLRIALFIRACNLTLAAPSAFFGIYLGGGRPSRSQVFTLELFPDWRRYDRNAEFTSAIGLETCIILESSFDGETSGLPVTHSERRGTLELSESASSIAKPYRCCLQHIPCRAMTPS